MGCTGVLRSTYFVGAWDIHWQPEVPDMLCTIQELALSSWWIAPIMQSKNNTAASRQFGAVTEAVQCPMPPSYILFRA